MDAAATIHTILGIDADELRAALEANRATLDELTDMAESEYARHGPDAGLLAAQIAAFHAWRNHSGVFASGRLEAIVGDAGRGLARSTYSGSARGASVLHVATEVYPTGGHTRLLTRWLAEANDRQDLALTRQALPVPTAVVEAVASRGGRIHDLSRCGSLSARSAALRSLASDVRSVSVHAHPYDVTPLAAFSSGSETPVTIINHADHVFWIGATVADRVVSIRDSGDQLVGSRRGIGPDRRRVVPLPIDVPHSTDKRPARQSLGLPDDELVILTVAQDYKLRTRKGSWYMDVMQEVLAHLPRSVRLIVVGTKVAPTGSFPGGQMTAVGEVRDPAPYYAAADIYLDGFPLGSLTSLLEAGSIGRAAVSYCLWPSPADLLCADIPSLKGHIKVESVTQLTECLAELVADNFLRKQHGEALASSIATNNGTVGWTALGVPAITRDRGFAPVDEISMLDLALNAVGQVDGGRRRAFQSQIRLASTWNRLRLWLAEGRSGRRLAASALLPERLAVAIWRRSRS